MSNLQKEIRIGNYLLGKIEDELDERKVYWKEYQIKDADDFAGIRDDWDKPIPLTEEWLVKLGFDYYPDNDSYQLESLYGFVIFGRIGKGFNVFVNSDEIGNQINFVHQLQNLFYALTGEELTIKGKPNDDNRHPKEADNNQ